MKEIYSDGPWFKDRHGRTLMLRGVNLGGSSKIPSHPNITSEKKLYSHQDVTFVGRPFPLDEADEHFARLKRWGLTFLRFLVTWEAIEHAGPGQYDEAYLDYLFAIVKRAGDYGLHMFIDPHQDAWSRLSGGDGAPGWTFDLVGLDVNSFRATSAANIYPFDDEPFVAHWQTNYNRLAAATMFTLFFGGNDFAPTFTIGDEAAQSFLQRHYINAIKQVAQRLQGLPNVGGFDTMNEPSTGFIGRHAHAQNEELYLRRLGVSPTPFQTMLLGDGYPQEVETWGLGLSGIRETGRVVLNPHGRSAWLKGHECLWRSQGVWELDSNDEPRLLRPHHFTHVMRDGQPYRVDFGRDYLRPFVNTFAREIRTIEPDALMFVENVPRLEMPVWSAEDAPNIVHASHWYDIATLFLRLFFPFLNMNIWTGKLVFGSKHVHRMFAGQLANIKQASKERMGDVPTLIGEFGTSFNMPGKLNYRLNWFTMQEWALDATFRALEANLLNGTLWNYTSDNSNKRGDLWNTEDLSIFSRDQQRSQDGTDAGGRALRAVVRPYPVRTAGEPLHMEFNMRRSTFSYTFRHDPTVQMPTEIFLPALHFSNGYGIEVTDGRYEYEQEQQLLRYWHGHEQETHTIRAWGNASGK